MLGKSQILVCVLHREETLSENHEYSALGDDAIAVVCTIDCHWMIPNHGRGLEWLVSTKGHVLAGSENFPRPVNVLKSFPVPSDWVQHPDDCVRLVHWVARGISVWLRTKGEIKSNVRIFGPV